MEKKQWPKYVASATDYFVSDMGWSKKGMTNPERSCQSNSFILKTDVLHLKTSYNDESACLWKQLKWNNFPIYADKLPGKNIHGE